MSGWIIYDSEGYRRNSWFANRLGEVLDCPVLIREELCPTVCKGELIFTYKGERIELPGFVVQRAIDPNLSYLLEEAGVRVFNSAKVSHICNHKGLTILMAQRLGIPTPTTAVANGPVEEVAYPAVIKWVSGHGGKEVALVNNREEYLHCLRSFKTGEHIIQPLLDRGRDKRVYLLGDRILGAVERSSDMDFRSNFSLGGRAKLTGLLLEEERAVGLVRECLKPDFVGIDFIYDKGIPLLNEVEDVVGTRMLYELTETDPVREYGAYILKQLN